MCRLKSGFVSTSTSTGLLETMEAECARLRSSDSSPKYWCGPISAISSNVCGRVSSLGGGASGPASELEDEPFSGAGAGAAASLRRSDVLRRGVRGDRSAGASTATRVGGAGSTAGAAWSVVSLAWRRGEEPFKPL